MKIFALCAGKNEGNWRRSLDVDEFYIDNPREFLAQAHELDLDRGNGQHRLRTGRLPSILTPCPTLRSKGSCTARASGLRSS